MKKRLVLIMLSLCIASFTSCSSEKPENTPKPTAAVESDVTASAKDHEEATPTVIATPTVSATPKVSAKATSSVKPVIVEEDYSHIFDGINGCAVIYDVDDNTYKVYNEAMINKEVSPYSTFKIVATLMGLKNKVLVDKNSTMKYNKRHYSYETWNHNLTLYEAFQASCVWYFRQVIDGVGYDKVEKELSELNYGNHNITKWKGEKSDSPAELKGFWLNSSLKISPMEQVEVLSKIFQGKSDYKKEQIAILKGIMLTDEVNGYKILGKTGTGINEGWYAGIATKGNKEYYFAVYLNEEQGDDQVSGAVARHVLLNIFKNK